MVIQGPSRLFVKQKEGWWFNLNISRSNLHFLFDHLFFKIENYWNADSKPIYLLTFSFRADLTQIQPWCINFTALQIIRLITSIQPGRNQTKEMASGKSDPDCSICNITSFFKSVSLKKTKSFEKLIWAVNEPWWWRGRRGEQLENYCRPALAADRKIWEHTQWKKINWMQIKWLPRKILKIGSMQPQFFLSAFQPFW